MREEIDRNVPVSRQTKPDERGFRPSQPFAPPLQIDTYFSRFFPRLSFRSLASINYIIINTCLHRLAQVLAQHLVQGFLVDGLHQIAVATGGYRQFLVGVEGMGREGDDRHFPGWSS